MARIYIIGYNSQKRVNRALASIPEGHDKILLDNGTIKLKAPEGVEYHETGPGMFTEAFNYALEDSIDHGEIPIICNDDIAFEEGCVDKLLEAVNDGAGLACPIQVDMALPDNVIMGGTMQAFPAGIHRTGKRGEICLQSRDYPWLPFCVVAVNPEAVRLVGYPCDTFKMWFSDSDYSIRVREFGFPVMLVAGAYVRHEQSAACNSSKSERLEIQFVLDQAAFLRKYGGQILEEYK